MPAHGVHLGTLGWLADITPLFEDFLDTVESYTERLEQVRGDLSRPERKHLFAVFDGVRDLVAYQFSVVELDADDRLARQVHWHALPDSWQTLTYQDFLTQRRHLMASIVKEAFGLLADHSYDPAYPAPTTVGEQEGPGGWTGYGVSVKDLLTAELLTPGTLLLPARDDLDAIAEVLADGRIRLDDELYDTPSGAARAAVGMATNGWTFWIADTAEGPRKLAELRATIAEA